MTAASSRGLIRICGHAETSCETLAARVCLQPCSLCGQLDTPRGAWVREGLSRGREPDPGSLECPSALPAPSNPQASGTGPALMPWAVLAHRTSSALTSPWQQAAYRLLTDGKPPCPQCRHHEGGAPPFSSPWAPFHPVGSRKLSQGLGLVFQAAPTENLQPW